MPFTILLTDKQRATFAALNAEVASAQQRFTAYVQALVDGAADAPRSFRGVAVTEDGLVLGDAPAIEGPTVRRNGTVPIPPKLAKRRA